MCHHAEVAKDFQCCYQRLSFLQCAWQSEILHRNQSTLMKLKGLAECHQTLSFRVWSQHKTTDKVEGLA